MSSSRKIIALVVKIKKWLFGPTTKFKVGDTVQLKSGGYLMVIVEVCKNRNMKRCLLHCQWYESEFHRTRWNLFPESSLMYFDWYAAK
ncbi:MAG: DUF2158 domain-containing protein [Cyclobacteriaceae bacterium]|nr:DUF2158 domain-containing protein [Cyclobacteriaceae bacterium]